MSAFSEVKLLTLFFNKMELVPQIYLLNESMLKFRRSQKVNERISKMSFPNSNSRTSMFSVQKFEYL